MSSTGVVSVLATLLLAVPLAAQADPRVVPKRPRLQAPADTNSAVEYYWFGVSKLVDDPQRAAAAFYWASRLDPGWAEPVYGRQVALVLANPYLLDGYIRRARGARRNDRLDAIDSLEAVALYRNPWISRRMGGAILSTWIRQQVQDSRVAQYIREDYPALGAWMSYMEGKFEQSAAEYATAVRRDPGAHDLQYLRALPFVALGQYDSAVTAVRAALTATRRSTVDSLSFGYIGYPFLEYSLGLLFIRAQQPDSAQAAYERALVDDIRFAPAHFALGRILLARSDTARALAEWNQAVALDPGEPQWLYELAVLSLAAQQPDSALTMLQRAIDAEPYFAPPRFVLARLYDISDYRREAIGAYQGFLRLAPRTPSAQLDVARTRLAALGGSDTAP